jgi:hypothetical protein
MKHLHTFESFLNEGTNPKTLVGKKSHNYHGAPGTIVAAEYVKDFDKLEKYDESGWMNPAEIKAMGLSSNDILVAFEDKDGETQVYTYGDGGVDEI